MAKVVSSEPPVVTRRHLVCIDKDDDDDWGTLPDAVYGRLFAPNRAHVIVVETNDGSCFADWMQVREHIEGEGWERCNGTSTDVDWLEWAHDVMQLAVQHVRGLVASASGAREAR